MQKIVFLSSSLLLAALFTACPNTNLPGAPTANNQFQVAVSPVQLKIQANSSVTISVQLEHPEQTHGEVRIQLTNLPNGMSAQMVSIPANASQTQLELHTTSAFQAATPTFVTVQADANQITSTALLELLASNASQDKSNINARFSSASPTNANLQDFQSQIGYANFKGSTCQIMTSDHSRNLLICLTAPYATGRSYQLVNVKHFGSPGTALVTYFERSSVTATTTNAPGNFWDSADGTLTLSQASSSVIEFQVKNATMTPANDFEKNGALNNFKLEIEGHIEDISNLEVTSVQP